LAGQLPDLRDISYRQSGSFDSSNGSLSDTEAGVFCIEWFTIHSTLESVMNIALTNLRRSPPSILRSGVLCGIGAMLSVCAVAAMAATSMQPSDAQSRYEAERATCMNGASNQDRTTCLKEAGAARDEARKGQLSDGDGKLRQNAKQRCDALSGDEARDCMARMKGKGTTSGSVQGGGILRETVTTETHTVDAPMPMQKQMPMQKPMPMPMPAASAP